MSLWLVVGVVAAGITLWYACPQWRLFVRSVLDDIDESDRARLVAKHQEAERLAGLVPEPNRFFSPDPACLDVEDLVGEDLDEASPEFLVWQRAQLGDVFDWTEGEVADAILSIRSLTRYHDVHWQERAV